MKTKNSAKPRMGLANTVAAEALTRKILPNKIWHSGNMTCIENVHCIHETTKAILVVVEQKEVWVPKSIVLSQSEVKRTDDFGNLAIDKNSLSGRFAATIFLDKALRA